MIAQPHGPIGVGIIGLGVGEQHALAFAAHPDCRVVALCDRDDAKLTAVAGKLPGTRLYHRADELIDDREVEAVSVASNDDDHHPQVVRALRARKHVFAEKPLCLHANELRDIREAWRESPGVRLSTNTVLRRSPRFRWLKDAVDAGQFGRVFCVEADYVYGRLHKLTDGWRGRIPGYSVMLGGGIHLVDLVLWILAERPAEVVAYGSDLGSRGTTFAGRDLAVALLRFDSGLVVKIAANFAAVHPHVHRFLVYGTKATFENAPESPGGPARLWTSRCDQEPVLLVDAPYPGVGKGDLIPAFVDAVLGRGEPDVAEDEIFAAVSVCLAIDRALAEGRPVGVEYD